MANELYCEAWRAASFAVYLRAVHAATIDATAIENLARDLWARAVEADKLKVARP